MKKYIILILLAIILCVTGCSSDKVETEQDRISLVVQYQQLKSQYEQIAYQTESQQVIYNDTIVQLEQSNSDLLDQALYYQSEYNKQVEVNKATWEESTRLKGELVTVWQDAYNLADELDKTNISLNTMHEKYEEITESCADPRYFDSEEELAAFLEEDKTDELPYVIDFFMCADFADELCARAKEAGYILWPESWPENVKYTTGKSEDNPHALCHTYINGIDYFVESMTDDYWQQYGLTDISEAVWVD